jgi:arylsulfatase A-like enzyme
MPELPTIEEAAGLKGFEASSWFGLLAPAGTPPDVVNRIQQEVAKSLATPAMKERLAILGAIPSGNTPAQFAAMISILDQYVGEIIKAIADKGLAENTLIIFTSDNGPHRENGGDPEFFNSSGAFRGIKRDLYEGGIRVPYVAYWPGKIKPAVNHAPAALWDMYPTILELAGIKNKVKTDGLSLVPVLLNKGKRKQHKYFYWEFHENNGRQAISWKNWKAIRLNVSTATPSPVELYDISKDPEEKNNLAEQFPAIVNKLSVWMMKAHVYNPEWPLLFSEKK